MEPLDAQDKNLARHCRHHAASSIIDLRTKSRLFFTRRSASSICRRILRDISASQPEALKLRDADLLLRNSLLGFGDLLGCLMQLTALAGHYCNLALFVLEKGKLRSQQGSRSRGGQCGKAGPWTAATIRRMTRRPIWVRISLIGRVRASTVAGLKC